MLSPPDKPTRCSGWALLAGRFSLVNSTPPGWDGKQFPSCGATAKGAGWTVYESCASGERRANGGPTGPAAKRGGSGRSNTRPPPPAQASRPMAFAASGGRAITGPAAAATRRTRSSGEKPPPGGRARAGGWRGAIRSRDSASASGRGMDRAETPPAGPDRPRTTARARTRDADGRHEEPAAERSGFSRRGHGGVSVRRARPGRLRKRNPGAVFKSDAPRPPRR